MYGKTHIDLLPICEYSMYCLFARWHSDRIKIRAMNSVKEANVLFHTDEIGKEETQGVGVR